MPAEVATSVGAHLYAQLAQLLAPAGSLGGTAAMVILETAGKDVGVMGAGAGPAAAEALADLANAVPAAAASFVDIGTSYDDVWNFVLTSAAPAGPTDGPVWATVARVIADNRADFDLMALAREDIPADVYHPVRATPADWLAAEGWGTASFRIGGDNPDPTPQPPPELFIPEVVPDLTWRQIDPLPGPIRKQPPVINFDPGQLKILDPGGLLTQVPADDSRIGGVLSAMRANQPVRLPAGLRWRDVLMVSRLTESNGTVSPVSPQASGFRLSFDYRVVGLQRPWLQPQLCRLAGWTIPGLPADGLSTGRLTDNPGLLPVFTTQMLAVRNLVVEARWSEEDKNSVGNAEAIAFGPFTISGADGFDGSRLSRPTPQVVAWLATVVPACPVPDEIPTDSKGART